MCYLLVALNLITLSSRAVPRTIQPVKRKGTDRRSEKISATTHAPAARSTTNVTTREIRAVLNPETSARIYGRESSEVRQVNLNLSINQSLFASAITSKQQKSMAGCQNRQ